MPVDAATLSDSGIQPDHLRDIFVNAVHERIITQIPAAGRRQQVWVPIESLRPADSPRLAGLNSAHAEALAEVDGELPPILVQRSTMRVIDGMHRLGAARMRGKQKVCVLFLDCGEEDAFLLAVSANIRHGLPLTLADRRAAAARIMKLRPEASDRWIAELAGLAAKTVAAIRHSSPGSAPALTHRLGRDGRVRPVNAAEGRRLAQELITSNPDAPLRLIARNAGISVGTARDVRDKMRRGLDPIESKNPAASMDYPADSGRAEPIDYRQILEKLRRDPSLRYTDSGRSFLRWLCPPRILDGADWRQIVDLIPPQSAFDVIRVARSCAHAWSELAEELDRRNGNQD